MHRANKSKLRAFEKMAYLLGIPVVAMLGGYAIYNKNVLQADERAEKLRRVEEKYLAANPENMIKLQNFETCNYWLHCNQGQWKVDTSTVFERPNKLISFEVYWFLLP